MIDERAIIDPKAKLGRNVTVGAYSIIGANVEIDDDTYIGPHVVIEGPTTIGKRNKIFQYASLGTPPQDLKYKGEDTVLQIGDDNVIREFATLNRGTVHGGSITKIGNRNLLMAYSHVAHDCIIGNNVVFANNASLAGHVIVQDFVIFGGFAVVAQHCVIGAYSFVSGQAGVAKDVAPYVIVSSIHGGASAFGLNLVGLRRNGFSAATIKELRNAYRVIFQSGLTTNEALPKLQEMATKCPEIERFIDMLTTSKRGIIR